MAVGVHAFIATLTPTSTSTSPAPLPPTCVRSFLTLRTGRRVNSRRASPAASGTHKRGGGVRLSVRGSLGGETTGGPPQTAEGPDYVKVSIMEAAELCEGPAGRTDGRTDGCRLKMNDGHLLACNYIHPKDSTAAPRGPQAALVLRLEDGSGIMLPIVVVEYPRTMVMDAVKNIHMVRPTVYQVMKDMVAFLGYKIQMVRVTHRENDSYFARVFLEKGVGGGEGEVGEVISLDMRPSDAINLAVRAKAPIEVNRALALKEGVLAAVASRPLLTGAYVKPGPTADKPTDDMCLTSEEFSLVRSIAVAALLERYTEAARLKDELAMFRAAQGISMREGEGEGEAGQAGLQQQDQCGTVANAIAEKLKNAGKEEAIEDARRRFTVLLKRS